MSIVGISLLCTESRHKFVLNITVFKLMLVSLMLLQAIQLISPVPIDTFGKKQDVQIPLQGSKNSTFDVINQSLPLSDLKNSLPNNNLVPNDVTGHCPPGWFRGNPNSCACFKMYTRADRLLAKSLQLGGTQKSIQTIPYEPLLAHVVKLNWYNAMQSCQLLYPGAQLLSFETSNEMDLLKNFFCPLPFIGFDSWIQQAVYGGSDEYSAINFDRYRNERNGFCSLLYMTPYGDLANVTTRCDEAHSFICKINLGNCITNQTFNNPLSDQILRPGEILAVPPGQDSISPSSAELFDPLLGKHGSTRVNVQILGDTQPLVFNGAPVSNNTTQGNIGKDDRNNQARIAAFIDSLPLVGGDSNNMFGNSTDSTKLLEPGTPSSSVVITIQKGLINPSLLTSSQNKLTNNFPVFNDVVQPTFSANDLTDLQTLNSIVNANDQNSTTGVELKTQIDPNLRPNLLSNLALSNAQITSNFTLPDQNAENVNSPTDQSVLNGISSTSTNSLNSANNNGNNIGVHRPIFVSEFPVFTKPQAGEEMVTDMRYPASNEERPAFGPQTFIDDKTHSALIENDISDDNNEDVIDELNIHMEDGLIVIPDGRGGGIRIDPDTYQILNDKGAEKKINPGEEGSPVVSLVARKNEKTGRLEIIGLANQNQKDVPTSQESVESLNKILNIYNQEKQNGLQNAAKQNTEVKNAWADDTIKSNNI